MKICHIADVHFRGLERHDEYMDVFNRLMIDANASNVDHIFIAGDIFHTKVSGITPEFIDILTNWLLKLSYIAPVHMMLGNHDGNLVNASRQDAISPIVNAINSDRIKLYKKSGVFEFAPGYEWVVFSPFDVETWDNLRGNSDNISIGCFHGPVLGCLLDTGIAFGEGTEVSFFESRGLDFVLLGDIHKHQYIASRPTSSGEEKPWIAYPGSTIQQNYGEAKDHGWLLWTIDSRSEWDVQFCVVENERAFVTIDWSADTIESLNAINLKRNRVRIRSSEQLDPVSIKNVTQVLRSRGVSDVAFKFETQRNIKNGHAIDRTTLRSSSNLIKLMKDMKGEDTLSGVDWVRVQAYLDKIIVENSFKTANNSIWTVNKLSFDNILSYGESNVIDFSKLNGIVGLFGPNRIGKSSIIGSLAYALFNSSDRSSRGGDIINATSTYAKASLEFERNGESYSLERQIVKGKKGTTTHLNLMKGSEDLIGEQRSETDKVIREIVGTYDDFRITTFSTQGELSAFLTEGPTARRSILSRFLDLDFLDQLFEFVKVDHSASKALLKKFDVTNFNDQLTQKISELDVISSKLKEATLMLDSLKENERILISNSSNGAKQKITVLTKKISQTNEQISLFLKDIEVTESSIRDLTEKLDTINAVISDIDIDSLKVKQSELENIQKNIVQVESSIKLVEADKKAKLQSLKVLDEVPCGDSFPSCKFITNAFEAQSKLPAVDSSITKLQENLNELVDQIARLNADELKKKIEKRIKADQLKINFESELQKENTRLSSLNTRISNLKSQIETDEFELGRLQATLRGDTSDDELANLATQIKSTSQLKDQLHTLIGRLEASITEIKTKQSEYEQISAEFTFLDLILNSLSKKGLPTFLISKEIPAINSEIAKILANVVNFDVELSIDTSGSIDISLSENNVSRSIEMCSGMERMITSLAIRVALTNLCAIPHSDFLVIDEGFGALDESNLASCNRLLESLKRFYRFILIVTHVDAVKDIADQIITVERVGGKSQVNFQ